MYNTLTIDLETTIRSPIGSKGSPFWPDNKMVVGGAKYSGLNPVLFEERYFEFPVIPDYIVGQNFKFDIQYIRRDNPELYKQLIDIDWWDTQVAEYILTAQQHQWASLNELAAKYGGTQKEEKIKEYWDAGIDTTDIPKDMLEEYLIDDLINTELVAHKQMEKAKARGQFDLIVLMSNAVKAYADMEYNGLVLDRDTLNEVKETMERERDEIRSDIYTSLYCTYTSIPHAVWNIDSNQQLSAIIFGGTIKWSYMETVGQKEIERNSEKVEAGVFKSGPKKGQTRYRWKKERVLVDDKVKVEGSQHINYLGLTGKKEWANNNGFSTADEILKAIVARANTLKRKPTRVIDFLEKILRLRFLNKQIDTYCVGLDNLVFPDGKIHHNLNNVATVTSRLSSSGPNMQNIPRKGDTLVKKFFVSRFGSEGRIVQVDYSQLEVVWQAFVTGDKNLKQGIRDGIDFHCARLAKKEGLTYEEVFKKCKVEKNQEWDEKRSNIKVFTFQRAYGAGAKAISKATGMPLAEVKKLIENEVEMYPDVEGHFKKVKAIAERNMINSVGFYKSLTGRAYAYPEYDGKWGKSMSPQQLRNYDIQGGATGDLVPAFIYSLFKKIHYSSNRDKVFLINTVHDSIILDVHESVCYGVCKGLKRYLEDVSVLKDSFGIDFDIPLKVDIEYGLNWKELETFKPN